MTKRGRIDIIHLAIMGEVGRSALSAAGWEVACGRRAKARGAVSASVATKEESFRGELVIVIKAFAGKVFIMEANTRKSDNKTRMLVTLSILIAMEIVLSRFLSVSAWNTKIGFSFVPIVLAAMLYGPLAGGIVAALGDFIGAILFPIGAYFPGFTLTAFLSGLIFGLFLYRSQAVHRVVAAVLINQFVLSLFVNTLWISILYGSPYGPLLLTRITQTLILSTVQILSIIAITRALPRFRESAGGMA